MTRQTIPTGWLVVVAVVLCVQAGRAQADEGKQLKVCGDPNNLPFSNEKLEGIENKIADVIAADLGMTVAYTWWPHQRGLVKRVLNTGRCDVMLGIPKGYDPVLWTKPYYRTGYVIAYRKGKGLKVRSLDDPALKTLKIGVQVNTPPHDALGQLGIVGDNVVGYQLMFDSNFHAEDYPGKLVEDLLAGTRRCGAGLGADRRLLREEEGRGPRARACSRIDPRAGIGSRSTSRWG